MRKHRKMLTVRTYDTQLKHFLAWAAAVDKVITENGLGEAVEWEIGRTPNRSAKAFVDKCDRTLYPPTSDQ